MKTGKEFAAVIVSDTMETRDREELKRLAAENGFNLEEIIYSYEVGNFLTNREKATPFSLMFEEKLSNRIADNLKSVFFGFSSKNRKTNNFLIVYADKETFDKAIFFSSNLSEQTAASWLGCYFVEQYSGSVLSGTNEIEALLDLQNKLRNLKSSSLICSEKDFDEIFSLLENITDKQKAFSLKKSLEDIEKDEQKQETSLFALQYSAQILEHTNNGDLQGAKYFAQKYIAVCEGKGKTDETLFEGERNFTDYKIEMKQKTGLETGLYLQIEGSPEISPFELIEGVTLVCGARKHGKTTFLLNMLFNEATKNINDKNGKQVLFYSYEVPRPRILQQFFALYMQAKAKKESGGHNLKREISDYYSETQPADNETKQYREIIKEQEKAFFETYIKSGALVVISKNLFAEELCESIKTFCRTRSCSLVGLDYIQELYSSLADVKKKSRADQLKYIGEQLRETVNELNLPLLAAAQFNRQIKTPLDIETDNIGEAGDLERNAVAVLGLYNLKELKPADKQTDTNAVASMLYSLGVDAWEMLEPIPKTETQSDKDEKRLKPVKGKLFCKLICARYSEAPSFVVLDMEGKSGFVDIKGSKTKLEDIAAKKDKDGKVGMRQDFKTQLNNLSTSDTVINTTKKTKGEDIFEKMENKQKKAPY